MPWSYTALTSYEQCPKRYFHTRVAKDVTEPEHQALLWGNQVHKALEERVRDGKPLPTGMTQWEPLAARIAALDGELITERQIALDKAFHPCDWFGKDVWVRGVIDVGAVQEDKVIALDWKTGKPKPDLDQLKLFAALAMAVWPQVQKVKTGYVWLTTLDLETQSFTRDDLPKIWGSFLMRLKRLDRSFRDDHWPENPSGLCKAWCPVRQCQFNGRYDGR